MTRTPKPTDLLTARQIADEKGWEINVAENILRVVARENGGAVRVRGVRKVFILRSWLEERIGQGVVS